MLYGTNMTQNQIKSNQIKQKLSIPESIAYVSGLLRTDGICHRSELAARVCEKYGFHDPRVARPSGQGVSKRYGSWKRPVTLPCPLCVISGDITRPGDCRNR